MPDPRPARPANPGAAHANGGPLAARDRRRGRAARRGHQAGDALRRGPPGGAPAPPRTREAFRAAYKQALGRPYSPYSSTKTAQERATITRWWEDALRTARARLAAEGTPEALDDVLGCLPAWTDRSHERWTACGWHEPTVATFMPLVTEALEVWEACLGPLTQVAEAALTQAAVVEPAQVAPAIAAQYTTQVQEAQAQLAAVVIPAEATRAQKTQLRREQTQRRQALQTLLEAQEAAITRQLKQRAAARQKLETLVTLVHGYPATLRRKLGKASVDVLPRIVWIYACEREGGEVWHGAKQEVRRLLRAVPPSPPRQGRTLRACGEGGPLCGAAASLGHWVHGPLWGVPPAFGLIALAFAEGVGTVHGEAEVVTADEIGQVRRRILAEAMGPVVPIEPLPEHELGGGAGPAQELVLDLLVRRARGDSFRALWG